MGLLTLGGCGDDPQTDAPRRTELEERRGSSARSDRRGELRVVENAEYVPPRTRGESLAGLKARDLRYRRDSVRALSRESSVPDDEVALAMVAALSDALWDDVHGELLDWRQSVTDALIAMRPLPDAAYVRLVEALGNAELRPFVLQVITESDDSRLLPPLNDQLSSQSVDMRFWAAIAISRTVRREARASLEPAIVARVVDVFISEANNPVVCGRAAALVEISRWGGDARRAAPVVLALIRGDGETGTGDSATLAALQIGVSREEILDALSERTGRGLDVLNSVLPVAESLSRPPDQGAALTSKVRALARALRASGRSENRAAEAALLGKLRRLNDEDLSALHEIATAGSERAKLYALGALQTHGRLDGPLLITLRELCEAAAEDDVRAGARTLRARVE